MKLAKTTQLVRAILLKYPTTRGNDYLLWLKVIEAWSNANGLPRFTRRVTVEKFLKELRQTSCPPYHSVSRARRKLQAKFPELKATAKVQAARAELEGEYREYAKADI